MQNSSVQWNTFLYNGLCSWRQRKNYPGGGKSIFLKRLVFPGDFSIACPAQLLIFLVCFVNAARLSVCKPRDLQHIISVEGKVFNLYSANSYKSSNVWRGDMRNINKLNGLG